MINFMHHPLNKKESVAFRAKRIFFLSYNYSKTYIYIVKSVLKCKKHKTKINEVEVDREVDQNREVQQ